MNSCSVLAGSLSFRLVCLGRHVTHTCPPASVCHPRKASANQAAGQPARIISLSVSIDFVTKLYVGNLPVSATEDSVRSLFAPHGVVEKVSLPTDRETNRPRGFGFVEMSNADASRATQALNGTDFEGRTLKVNEAQDKPRSGGGGGPRRY